MDLSGREFIEDRLQLRGRDQLTEIDGLFRRGAFEEAESEYSKLLGRYVQNPPPQAETELPWMLHRLGLSYLEIRDFDRAYENFSKAADIRRANVQALEQIPQPDQKQAAYLTTCRAQLDRLLVLLGRLDLAKGDLTRAGRELADAVSIGNQYVRLEDAGDALYFQSLVFEKAGKWDDAERMWQQAAKIRERMTLSDAYWDMLEDMAGFYARRGDFHAAAEIAKRVQTETAGKQLRPNLDIPGMPEWFHSTMSLANSEYKSESAAAMAEILAMDRWISDGPDAAAALLTGRPLAAAMATEGFLLRRGSDSDRARLLEYISQRAFLQMSILLDGRPSPERVARAYDTIQRVKGGLIASIADITTTAESDRNNPSGSAIASISAPVMLDELAAARTRHAHMFVASALDGKPFDARAFAKSEEAEQGVTEGLGWQKRTQAGNQRWLPGNFADDTTAAIDITAWERIDRANPAVSHREYGAFVVRKGRPAEYVRLGAAEDIDRDAAALEAGVVGPHLRGVRVIAAQGLPADETGQLRRLYEEVIAPLESSLTGVKKLVIVPDGKLTLAPIDAFIDSQGQYAMQRYTVTYFGYEMKRYDERDPAAKKTTAAIVIANPDFDAALADSGAPAAGAGRMRFEALPGAEFEAGDVRQALHLTADRVLTGKNAREETIRSLGGPEILHFATHSVPYVGWTVPVAAYDLFDYPRPLDEDPLLQSVIALAGANRPQTGPEDGLLTGLEIASLRLLGTKLVVLSTCEAGQGTPVDGQGVLGLRAAFSMAGAQGAVMSLWPVDDQAGRRFMQFFYSHLDAGPAEAVRLAQLDMVEKTQFKQPRYWAGYSYSGDPGVRVGPRAPAESTPEAAAHEVVAAPACLEVTTRGSDPNRTPITIYRVKISGAVRKSSPAPEQVMYELLPPSSDLEISGAYSIDQAPPGAPFSVRLASQQGLSVSLTIERTKEASGVYIREYVGSDNQLFQPQTVLSITLKGGPNLFPSFDIPALPAIGAYTEASISHGAQYVPEKVATAGACPVER
ncbi:MAG TPA: CHAT domain-containing protein [Bryobacteraceae bacterium]|nr:CHAT domain-containing protein [Bryobacteraceae bacterium]